jgi:hypothetical protein
VYRNKPEETGGIALYRQLNTGCTGTNQRRLEALHYVETIEHWVYRNKSEENGGTALCRQLNIGCTGTNQRRLEALHYIETILFLYTQCSIVYIMQCFQSPLVCSCTPSVQLSLHNAMLCLYIMQCLQSPLVCSYTRRVN